MLDFLLWFPYPMRIAITLLIMFSVVPITGFLVTGGNLRQTWAYTKIWLIVVGGMAAVGAGLALLFI